MAAGGLVIGMRAAGRSAAALQISSDWLLVSAAEFPMPRCVRDLCSVMHCSVINILFLWSLWGLWGSWSKLLYINFPMLCFYVQFMISFGLDRDKDLVFLCEALNILRELVFLCLSMLK